MRTSVAEVNQSQGSCSSGSGQCYQTVAQCNVSTISSKLDGNQTLKVRAALTCVCVSAWNRWTVWQQHQTVLFRSQSSTLKGRNGSEWRAYCNLNDIGQLSSPLCRRERSHSCWMLCTIRPSRAKTNLPLAQTWCRQELGRLSPAGNKDEAGASC